MAPLEIMEKLGPVWEGHPEVVFCYLFGSAALSEGNQLSDIDLAVYVENPEAFSFQDKLLLHADCCRALITDRIDLVVVNQTRNLMLLDEIIRHGMMVYDRDLERRMVFEVDTLHRAIDFQEQRRMVMGV